MNYLVVFPTTGVCRAFTHFNLISEWYGNNTAPVLRPSDLTEFWHNRKPVPLIDVHQSIWSWGHERGSWRFPQDVEDQNITWEMAHAVAEVINRPPRTSEPAPTPQKILKRGFQIDLDAARTFIETKEPKQARVIAQSLLDGGYDFYGEDEMKHFMVTMVAERKLKTKQDPWRILRYYRPTLADHGVLVYND